MRQSLKFALEKLGKINKAVEVGIHKGKNAVVMLMSGVEKLYLIDSYPVYIELWKTGPTTITREMQDNWKKEMLIFLSPYWGRVTFLEMSSKEASNHLNEEFDYIYIDANHDYEYIKEDIELWYPKVKVGGILAGHDYGTTYIFGVKIAVDEFCKKNNFELHTSDKDGDWWIVK